MFRVSTRLPPPNMAPSTPPHQTNTEWNTPKRQEVLDLSHHMHLRPREIKEETDVPTPTIRRILHSNQPRHDKNPRTGRPPGISPRDLRALVRAIISGSDGRRAPYTVIAKELGIVASESTLRKYLRQAGIRRCIACKKPLVSKANRVKRLKWAREHLHWELEDWLRIIFTDETTYETGQRGKVWVSRRPGERFCPDCASNFKHSGRESVMVWGGFCGDQCSDLVEFKKTSKIQKHGKKKGQLVESISGQDYVAQILESHLKPWYKGLKDLGYRPIFMQDNAPIHKNGLTRAWFKKNNIEVLDWPPDSPDLNPDEYMWNRSKQKIKSYPRLIFRADKMYEAAYHEWHALTDRYAQLKWVASMQDRCRAVIKAGGGSTKY